MLQFSSSVKKRRIYATNTKVDLPNHLGHLQLRLPHYNREPSTLKIKQSLSRAILDHQPTPVHDFINFKKMSGNEILLNLENHANFSNSELLGAMLELAKRDRHFKFNWNNHPITAHALIDLKQRVKNMNAKGVLQAAIILDGLQILDQEAWTLCQKHILRMLHKYKGRDMALFLDLFDKDVLDEKGEAYMFLRKAPEEFFERITSILPMHINFMSNQELIRSLEVLVKKELGSERLFLHYLYLKIERNVLAFTVPEYC